MTERADFSAGNLPHDEARFDSEQLKAIHNANRQIEELLGPMNTPEQADTQADTEEHETGLATVTSITEARSYREPETTQTEEAREAQEPLRIDQPVAGGEEMDETALALREQELLVERLRLEIADYHKDKTPDYVLPPDDDQNYDEPPYAAAA